MNTRRILACIPVHSITIGAALLCPQIPGFLDHWRWTAPLLFIFVFTLTMLSASWRRNYFP